jgi:hypothetical protein
MSVMVPPALLTGFTPHSLKLSVCVGEQAGLVFVTDGVSQKVAAPAFDPLKFVGW